MNFRQFHPPHRYLNNTYYFITARTKDKLLFLNTSEQKLIFKRVLESVIKQKKIKLFGWVILDNHYHLLLYVKNKPQLIQFMKGLHGKSAIELNKMEGRLGRKIWVNYWDRCMRDEKDFYTHLNYIHNNPVKHGYAKEMNKYKFSSYNNYLLKCGEEWLSSCFNLYPVFDFIPQDV